jgi:putative transposase
MGTASGIDKATASQLTRLGSAIAMAVRISMDGRGRFLDNIFIERLWRSMKYECIYLHAFSGGREAR